MKDYIVGIQVIKVYNVKIKAKDVDEAIGKAYNMSSEAVEKDGDMVNVETDYAEIVEEA